MVEIFLVIIASCALTQALVTNEWNKVKSPLSSDKYRVIHSKLFSNSSSENKFLKKSNEGQAAELGQFPYYALLELRHGIEISHACGGSIISPHWILTAAHWFVHSETLHF